MPDKILFLIIIALTIFGAPVSAQVTTIPVRAGEHMEFTRLVIQIPSENSWRVTSEGRTGQLIVDGPELRFDLSQTFSKIPRTRLRAVRTTSDGLAFELACDCALRAYEDIPQFLVIDILGDVTKAPKETLSNLRPQARPEGLTRSQPEQSLELGRAGRDLARRLRGSTDTSSEPASLPLHPALANELLRPSTLSDNEAPTEAQLAREVIARELGRALSNSVAIGALQPSEHFSQGSDRSDLNVNGASGTDSRLHDHLELPRDDRLRTTAASDPTSEICRMLASMELQGERQDTGRLPGPPSIDGVFGEFDQLDRGRLIRVIGHFLNMGFGTEARLVASLLAPDDPLIRLVLPISHAVDLDPHAGMSAPEGIASCGPSGLLWAFLVENGYPVKSHESLNMLVQASEALPVPLRLHLGPAIVQRLVSQGHVSTAQRIQASISRVTHAQTPELQLASVTVALAASDSAHDRELENSLSPELSDEALVFLLTRRDLQGEGAEAELVALAEDRLLALRGDPLAAEITRLLARALTRNSAFDKSFELAASRHSGLTAAQASDLQHWILDALVQSADDTVFVVNTFSQQPWANADLPFDLRETMAARLDRLGFADQARLLREARLSGLGSFPDNHTDDSQLMPSTGGTAVAEEDASDVFNMPDVVRARTAQAQLQTERDSAARVPVVTNTQGSLEENSMAGPPSQLRNVSDTLESGISTLPREVVGQASSAALAPQDPDLGLLSQARTALDDSEGLRMRLQAMLAQPRSEEGQESD
ncbi:MAG: hypothetical protein JJU07_07410 [Natronohydrobacter sp.]|nr:hypothetical protein [Natronohydrobacter sp.]